MAMPDPTTLLLFARASLALLAVPGPAVIYMVTRSVDQGRAAGIVSVLGVETGGLVHVVAATVGLSALVASSAAAFGVLKSAGAGYLVYLGVRRIVWPDEGGDGRDPSSRRMFAQGMVVQGLNPKVAIFFLAFLPQFVDPDAGAIAPQILVLGIVFTLIAGLCDGAWALLAGTVGPRLRRSASGSRRLARVSGGIYIGLGITAALAGGHSRPSNGDRTRSAARAARGEPGRRDPARARTSAGATAARGLGELTCSRRAASRWSPVQIIRTAVAVALPVGVAQVVADGLDQPAVGDVVARQRLGHRRRGRSRLRGEVVDTSRSTSSLLASSSARAPRRDRRGRRRPRAPTGRARRRRRVAGRRRR